MANKKEGSWNTGNPSVKRILKEAKEFNEHPRREFVAAPLEDNVFEWIFTIRGPDESEYENGFYRGRIILKTNYPWAPPDIMILTPNGRFELNKKICLSISSYHPENWHPTWGIRTVLNALREFMSTPGNNAIGAIDYPKDVRKQLAKESHDFICPVLNVSTREDMELMNGSPPSTSSKPESVETPPCNPAQSPSDTPSPIPQSSSSSSSNSSPVSASAFDDPSLRAILDQSEQLRMELHKETEDLRNFVQERIRVKAEDPTLAVIEEEKNIIRQRIQQEEEIRNRLIEERHRLQAEQHRLGQAQMLLRRQVEGNNGFTIDEATLDYLIVGIIMAIAAIVFKKFLTAAFFG